MDISAIGEFGNTAKAWVDLGKLLTTEAQKDAHQYLGHQLDRLADSIS